MCRGLYKQYTVNLTKYLLNFIIASNKYKYANKNILTKSNTTEKNGIMTKRERKGCLKQHIYKAYKA